MYFDMHPLLIARAAMAASRKSNNNRIEADLWITGTADMEGVSLNDERVAQARYWLQVESSGTFVVLISRYARGGFSVMRAAEEALSTDLWGPADGQGKRTGDGARAYVSPSEMGGQPTPSIYTLQAIPYLAELPRDPWAPQPTPEEVMRRITASTGIAFATELPRKAA